MPTCRYPLTLLLLTACLLPSCMQWHIADRLRDNETTYTGVDVAHKVGNKRYYDLRHGHSRDEAPVYYTAPEYTYKRHKPLLYTDFPKPEPSCDTDLRPTGRIVTVKSEKYQTTISALPRGLTAVESREEGPREPYMQVLSIQRDEPGWGRRTLTTTCDYVVDPLLTLITGTLEGCLYIALSPVFFTIIAVESVDGQYQLQSAPEPTPPTANQ